MASPVTGFPTAAHVDGIGGRPLPVPEPGPAAAATFVADHLAHLIDRRGRSGAAGAGGPASRPFRGGQRAADAALARFEIAGYRAASEIVYPQRRRATSQLSPWIRNGLLTLGQLWDHVAGGPPDDVDAFRAALVAHEIARLAHAGLDPEAAPRPRYGCGTNPGTGLDGTGAGGAGPGGTGAGGSEAAAGPGPGGWTAAGTAAGWDRRMGCVELALGELEDDGWLPHRAREWLLHLWLARSGLSPAEGELHVFRHLLDGNRAVNHRTWLRAAAMGPDPAAVSRWQVERRAPGLCATCQLAATCPIDHEVPAVLTGAPAPGVPAGAAASAGAPDRLAQASGLASRLALLAVVDPTDSRLGPTDAVVDPDRPPEAVWLTAESLGDADPALTAHPGLPAVFVFDEPLLAGLRLSAKRLVFLTEHLSDLATRRPVELWLGRPRDVLAGRALAATFTPVPGWHHRARSLSVTAVHPWPWLLRHRAIGEVGGSRIPHRGPVDGSQGAATVSSTGRNNGSLV